MGIGGQVPDKRLAIVTEKIAETLVESLEVIRPRLKALGLSDDDIEFVLVNGVVRVLSAGLASNAMEMNGEDNEETLGRLGIEASRILVHAVNDFMTQNVKKEGFVSLLIEPRKGKKEGEKP